MYSRLTIFNVMILTFLLATFAFPLNAFGQYDTASGISLIGSSYKDSTIVNGTLKTAFLLQSSISISSAILSYVQRNGLTTNATLSLAPGNSSTNGWWQATIQPRVIQQTSNSQTTYHFEPMTLYAFNAQGTTRFAVDAPTLGVETSIQSCIPVLLCLPGNLLFTIVGALLIGALLVAAVTVLVLKRPRRLPSPDSVKVLYCNFVQSSFF